MSILIALRHGRSTANTAGVLAGRTPGVDLDDTGVEQARALGARLAGIPLAAAISSPLPRCRRTLELALEAAASSTAIEVDDRLAETDYGAWSGRPLAELAKEPLWQVVQNTPQDAVFPAGEAMLDVRSRVVEAVLEHDSRLPDDAVWVLASHGDPLAALVNWAVGADFTHVQRIGLDPASASVLQLPGTRGAAPRVLTMNSHEGSLARWVGGHHSQVVGGSAD